MKKNKYQFVFPVLFILYACFFILPVNAATFSNQNYILEMQNSPDYPIENKPITPIQTKKQTEELKTALTFSLLENFVDFGLLSPTNPVIRSHLLRVYPVSLPGYTVSVFENHELSDIDEKALIPDTTCDNGACTDTIATSWESILSYGLGFRCDNLKGFDCQEAFARESYFQPFANSSNNQTPYPVMSGSGKDTERQAKITYKVNVATTQLVGSYANIVTYIASPNF